jgi:hypothetical protein
MYEVLLRTKPEPGMALGPWKRERLVARTRTEAINAAFGFKNANIPNNYEAAELWLYEGEAKTLLWQPGDLELDVSPA